MHEPQIFSITIKKYIDVLATSIKMENNNIMYQNVMFVFHLQDMFKGKLET